MTTSEHDFHLPIVTSDAGAGWVAEGDEIAPSHAAFDELVVTPRKLAGLTIVSRELAEDSTLAAAQVVGQSLARDMARKLDVALFGSLVLPLPPASARCRRPAPARCPPTTPVPRSSTPTRSPRPWPPPSTSRTTDSGSPIGGSAEVSERSE